MKTKYMHEYQVYIYHICYLVLLGKRKALNSGKSLSKYAETRDFVRFVVAMSR